MTYYRHFTYKNGGNPYISFTNKKFWELLKKYDIEMINETMFTVNSERECKPRTYKALKNLLHDFAVEYSLKQDDCIIAYSDLLAYNDFFETYGKRYGLLTEFRENSIC